MNNSNNVATISTRFGRVSVRPVTGGEQKVKRKFNPKWEYGAGVEIKSRTDKKAIEFLHQSAKEFLPNGTPYELRLQSINGGRIAPTACWYYNPRRSTAEKFSIKRWKFSISSGAYVRGIFFS